MCSQPPAVTLVCSSTGSSSTWRTPLLELPPELRNRIFELVVVSTYPRQANFYPRLEPSLRYNHLGSRNKPQRALASPMQPNLTSVNRQIRAETLQVLYARNNFLFSARDFDARVGTGHGRRELKQWLDLFFNDIALKHVEHVSWLFDREDQSPTVRVDITLQRHAELRYNLYSEPADDVCLCELYSRTPKLKPENAKQNQEVNRFGVKGKLANGKHIDARHPFARLRQSLTLHSLAISTHVVMRSTYQLPFSFSPSQSGVPTLQQDASCILNGSEHRQGRPRSCAMRPRPRRTIRNAATGRVATTSGTAFAILRE